MQGKIITVSEGKTRRWGGNVFLKDNWLGPGYV